MPKAQRSINECKRLGIPFGIYWYSYAEDAGGSGQEGSDVVSKLRQFERETERLEIPRTTTLRELDVDRAHAAERSERV